MMMNDMSMPTRQEREGTASADHVNRLPKAIEDQHRLIESSLHLGPWR